MADSFYRFINFLGIFSHFHVIGTENIVESDPAIFISNHAGSTGPISIVTSVPKQMHPWVIGEMTDPKRAPLYMYNDFILPALHLKGKAGMLLARLFSLVSVNLLRGLGSISVDRNRGWCSEAFYKSLMLLRQKKNLLIFPENPLLEADPVTGIRPFFGGFIWLGQMYSKVTGKSLPVIPLVVYPPLKTILVAKAFCLEFRDERRKEIFKFTNLIQTRVEDLYKGMMNRSLLLE